MFGPNHRTPSFLPILAAIFVRPVFALPSSMRLPRSSQLFSDSGSVHKFWRCHNKSYLLEDPSMKFVYMSCTKYALEHKSVSDQVKLSSYCIMSNHAHMGMTYHESSCHLSQFMRLSHAKFGRSFNRINQSTGKVANERPKTPLIEDGEHLMRVHFYVEANPVRAGFVQLSKLQFYEYSSYGYYAYGRETRWSHLLTIPQWYLDLGTTAKARQSRYRKLFKEYLGERASSDFLFKSFIGSYRWVELATESAKEHRRGRLCRENKKPPDLI